MTAIIDGRQLVDGQPAVTGGRETDLLPDLTDMSLADLLALAIDNPVLASSLQRVVSADDGSQGIVAGFQSAI